MSRKLRVLVADNDRAFAEALRLYISSLEDMECVACAYNGQDALCHVKDLQPDAVVLDVNMPYLDGVDFMKALCLMPQARRPAVYVVTAYADQVGLCRQLMGLGVRACLEKPYPFELLCERIRDGFLTPGQTYARQVERTVMHVMLGFRVSDKGVGYKYMQNALQKAILKGDSAWLLKDITVEIARSNNTSELNVEQALRGMVSKIYQEHSPELQDLLHAACCDNGRQMSCRDFVARMARAIQLKYGL